MKFKYKKYGSGIVRPVIPVEISYKGTSIEYEVLVDSGADICIFHAELADILGIDLTKGERAHVSGITGAPELQYIHPVALKVGGWEHKTKVGFLPNIGRLGYGVVGQRGFFDKYVVKFDFLKEEIELKRRI